MQEIVLTLFLGEKKMRAKVKKIIPYIFIVGLSVLLLSSLVYFGFKDKNMVRVANDQSSKMQYVLVNEDKGASFEGKYYSLGTDFVTLINKDTTNRWETATRDIATSGVENGQFDAQIIIPQDFSEKILSLQAIAPEKAQIEYQVRDGQNEITNQMIQNQVNGILKEFNRRVIQMYFSSIVNNLAEAQQNITQIVDTQLDQQADLENEIYTPFKEIPTSYTTVLNTASILDEDNKLFSAEQEAFVKSVQSLLDNNNAHLTSSSETTESVKKSVEEYSKEGNEKIKKSVQQFNEQYELHKKQLVNQWEKATTDYKKEFDQLNTTILDQMGNFYLSNNQGESGVYVDFLAESKLFQETQADRIKELQMEIAELHSQVEQLTALKKQIAKTYYNDSEATPETATDEQVKQAIIQLITGEKENIPKLKKNYEENLQNLIAQLPYESLKKLIDKLEENGILTSDQTIIFRNELQIVDKYAKDSGIGFGADVQFLYLEPKQIHDHTVKIPKKITFSLDTTKENRIVLEGSNHENIAFILNQNQMNTIKSEINIQLEKAGYEIPTIQSTPTQIIIPQPIKIKDGISENISEKENQNNSEEVIDNFKSETASLPNKVSFSIEIPLKWTLTTEQQQTAYQSIDYSWKVNDEIPNEGSFAVYIPMDKPLVQDIPELLKQIQVLDNAAQQVVTLFGTPNETLSIHDYVNMLNQEKNKDKSIKELAGKDSIYWMYDNITNEEKEEIITEKLLNEYKNTGNKLYQNTVEQINKLQKIIGTEVDQNTAEVQPTLYGTLNLMTVPEKLLQEANKLNNWYSESMKQINIAYDSWKETTPLEAESVITTENPHPEENTTTTVDSELNSLVKGVQSLIQTSKEMSTTTAESAAKVKDVTPTIKELKTSTTKVQDNAQNILTNLNDSIEASQKSTKENEDYAKTFEKVLANTKDGGADNPKVFNFLSSPIQGEGIFGKTRQISLIPYYATLIGAFLMLILAITLQGFMKKREVTEAEALVEPTRIWQNGPNILRILTVTFLIIGLFSGMLSMNASDANYLAWISYSFLVFVGGTLLTIGCMRQFKRMTLYIYCSLLGLFFMMTPLLGIATQPGSLSNWLYRLSPFQNIQNGYTMLMNGGKISWISYFILILLFVLGIVLNLFVQPEEQK